MARLERDREIVAAAFRVVGNWMLRALWLGLAALGGFVARKMVTHWGDITLVLKGIFG